MFRRRCSLALAVLVLFCAGQSVAAERNALLIANSRYEGSAMLRNPGNDADAMEAALRELGFSVAVKKDLDLRGMDEAVVAFRRALGKRGLALFFYSGHGVQVKGGNYLVPIGARLQEESKVKYECYEVGQVLDLMGEAESNLKVMILDCCRDNPFQRSWSRGSSKRGLASVSDMPQGTIIAFSTSPNQTASDGEGRNSPYTGQLVAALSSRPSEGLELSAVFRKASQAVKQQTGQVPWLNLEASLEYYYLWKATAAPLATSAGRPEPKKPKRVEAMFTVHEGAESGPELAGAEVQLRWLAAPSAAPAELGQATTDEHGKARIAVELGAAQQAGGSFDVMTSSSGGKKVFNLPGFPESRSWDLWAPGRKVQPAEKKPSSAPAQPQQREITNSIGMKLVLIPAGEFMMGTGESAEELAAYFNRAYSMELKADAFKDEYPQHRVRITKPFYLGQHEVTVGQFRKFVSDSGYKTDAEKNEGYEGAHGFNAETGKFEKDKDYSWRKVGFPQTDDHPVVNMSWNDAVAFCEWLSRKDGKMYHLPTEAEWEYACRAGTTTRYSSGDDPEGLAQVGNVADATVKAKSSDCKYALAASDGYLFTSPVGSFRPNGFSLYDMHGNAWEWCADWYEAEYYAASPADGPRGPVSGVYRVLRGGSWYFGPNDVRSADRNGGSPRNRNHFTGFRVARVPAD